jgi:DNA-binding HxlR family transcriptional regulator
MTLPADYQMRSDCPVSAVLDVFGDKWTFLIIRSIVVEGCQRFNEFAAMKEGIPTNILANRLKRLVDHGVLEKQAYQHNPPRYNYQLTSKGDDLRPIVQAMIAWGLKHVPGTGASKGYGNVIKTGAS